MAFGNLKFDTLTTSDAKNTNTEKSLDTSYVFNGSAKAWASITGDSFTLSDNFNVSSITDNATGRPEANFTNNMANATYSYAGGAYNRIVGAYATDGALTTSSLAVALVDSGGSFGDISTNIMGLQVKGDVA